MELLEAAKKGDFSKVKHLIESGCDVNYEDKDGYTALIFASFNGHLEIVKLLIAKGADINK